MVMMSWEVFAESFHVVVTVTPNDPSTIRIRTHSPWVPLTSVDAMSFGTTKLRPVPPRKESRVDDPIFRSTHSPPFQYSAFSVWARSATVSFVPDGRVLPEAALTEKRLTTAPGLPKASALENANAVPGRGCCP